MQELFNLIHNIVFPTFYSMCTRQNTTATHSTRFWKLWPQNKKIKMHMH